MRLPLMFCAALAGACSPATDPDPAGTAVEGEVVRTESGTPVAPQPTPPAPAGVAAPTASPAPSAPSPAPQDPAAEPPVREGIPAEPDHPVGPAVGPGKDLNGDGRITEDERPHY